MAFEQLHSQSGTQRLTIPALTIGKSMVTMNMAFCEAVGMKIVDDKRGLDLLYDTETNTFAIRIHKKLKKDGTPKGDKIITYNKSHQVQVYLKSMFKQRGYDVDKTIQIVVERDKKLKMWLFQIPEEFKNTEGKKVKVLKNKAKKKQKNKRKKSELSRKA